MTLTKLLKSRPRINTAVDTKGITSEDIADIFEVPPSEVRVIPRKHGLYGILVYGKAACFIKRSDELFRAFDFNDRQEADEYLRIYRELAEKEVYPPDSEFEIRRNTSEKFYLRAIIPALIVPGISESATNDFKRNMDEKKAICEQIAIEHEKTLVADPGIRFNYGQTKQGEVFYHDLHVFEEIHPTF